MPREQGWVQASMEYMEYICNAINDRCGAVAEGAETAHPKDWIKLTVL